MAAVCVALCHCVGAHAEPVDPLSTGRPPDLDAPGQQEKIRRIEPVHRAPFKIPSEVFFVGDVVCVITVQVERDGQPTEVTADEDCPSRLLKPAREAMLRWRWEPQAAPFTYVYRLKFKSQATFGLPLSYFETIARAYTESRSRGDRCELAFVLFANGKLTDLATNDKAQCMGLPRGKLAMPERRSQKLSNRHTCTLDLKVTSGHIASFQADPACPPPLVRFLRSRMSDWHWVAPTRSTRPYQVRVAWERQQR
ncbi:MAG: hypothetical protein EA397_17205 [Deltaproteobacteria bacterium]|nr:MAG: hypothetical protein EA397_17205 [Deltaproteobacteria bacterium]